VADIEITYQLRPGPGEWVSYTELLKQVAKWAMIPSAGPPAVTISKRVTETEAGWIVAPPVYPEETDRIVAYRNTDRTGVLLCREHGEGWLGLTPLTSEDLPDGGICTWEGPPLRSGVCGRDVLA